MSESEDQPLVADSVKDLESCRPLADPVRFWSRVVSYLVVVQVIVILVTLIIQLRGEDLSNLDPLLVKIFTGVLVLNFLSLWFFLRPFLMVAQKPKVLFLRAFSHDRKSDQDGDLRRTLKDCLPSDLSLGGIRPPDQRAGSWFRALGEGLVAMKYLGSNNFELEAADRNWFARLLSSASAARGLIVDLRDTTPFVHDEMKLVASLKAGPEKTFLIGDDSQTADHWYKEFQDASGFEGELADQVTLIQIPPKTTDLQSFKFRQKLAKTLSVLSDDPIGTSEESLSLAHQKVTEDDWATPWSETSLARFLKVFIPLGILSFLLPSWLSLSIALISVILFLSLSILAWCRLVRMSWRQRKVEIKPKPGFVALGLVFSPLIFLSFLISSSAWALQKAKSNAAAVNASMEMSSIRMAVNHFYEDGMIIPVEFPPAFPSNSEHGEQLLNILQGQPHKGDYNPRGMNFLGDSELSCFKNGYQGLGFMDPNGNPYQLFFDVEYMGEVKVTVGTESIVVPAFFAIVCAGPDGEMETEDDYLLH